MRAYSIDLYDKNMNCIHHTEVSPFKIDLDYLSPNENEFEIIHIDDAVLETAIYISIDGAISENIFAPITRVESGKYFDKIIFKTSESIFDRTILLDTSNEGTGISAENAIADIIRKEWINTSDEYERYSMNITIESITLDWTYALDGEYDPYKSVVNFYDDVLSYFLEKYRISVKVTCNYQTKKINVNIRKSADPFYIEADLPSVDVLNFVIKDQSESVNKVVVWDASNFQNSLIYYMHNDGSWDNIDRDRVLPVRSTTSVLIPTDESFESLAYKEAYDTFISYAWNNLIELNFIFEDSLVNPSSMRIGQNVKVIYHERSYDSVLTAKTIEEDGTITLSFGAIRHDLTKIISKRKEYKWT